MKNIIMYLSGIVLLVSITACQGNQQETSSSVESQITSKTEITETEDTVAQVAKSSPEELEAISVNSKQPMINEYKQLMEQTKIIPAVKELQSLKDSKGINFSEENKQIAQNLIDINAISLHYEDLKKLRTLAVEALQKYKKLNEALLSSGFDNIESIDQAFKQAVSEFKKFDQKVNNQYKLSQ